MACTLLCSSTVRVHVSHAYRNIDTTSDRISVILDRKVMFLSFHIDFSLVIAAVVWAYKIGLSAKCFFVKLEYLLSIHPTPHRLSWQGTGHSPVSASHVEHLWHWKRQRQPK